MSKIALSSNPSGTGTFTIESPSGNTDRTLTLPDEAGTVLVNGTNQNVGIGTSSPISTLEISAGAANTYLRINDTRASAPYVGSESGSMVFGLWGVGERARIDSSGNLLVGTTASEGPSRLSVVQTTSNQAVIACRHTLGAGEAFVRFINSTNNAVIGSIANSGNTSTAYNTTSDYRLKENVVPLAGAADRLAQIPVHRFNFIANPDRTVDGFLAHEVQAVVPEAVTGEKDAVDADGNPVYQGIDQSKLVPLLTAALQEALADIATLKTEIAALKGASA